MYYLKCHGLNVKKCVVDHCKKTTKPLIERFVKSSGMTTNNTEYMANFILQKRPTKQFVDNMLYHVYY